MSSLSQQNVPRSTWYQLIGLEWSSYREFTSPRFYPLVLTKCWSVSMNLKATFSVRCKILLNFHNKLHNMKALVILSHHDHHFSHLLVFMIQNELLWVPVSSSRVFSGEKTSHSSLFQHRCSYRDLCPDF